MKMLKTKLYLIICTFFISLIIATPVYAESISFDSNTVHSAPSIRKDNIGWRYKVINGILYKRLYNYSKNEWIGKWIKV